MFQDEFQGRPKVAQLLHQLANYDGGVEQNVAQEGEAEEEGGKKKKKKVWLKVLNSCLKTEISNK